VRLNGATRWRSRGTISSRSKAVNFYPAARTHAYNFISRGCALSIRYVTPRCGRLQPRETRCGLISVKQSSRVVARVSYAVARTRTGQWDFSTGYPPFPEVNEPEDERDSFTSVCIMRLVSSAEGKWKLNTDARRDVKLRRLLVFFMAFGSDLCFYHRNSCELMLINVTMYFHIAELAKSLNAQRRRNQVTCWYFILIDSRVVQDYDWYKFHRALSLWTKINLPVIRVPRG